MSGAGGEVGRAMPVFRNGSLVVYSLHVGEVCTTKAIDPPCYTLPPDLPPGLRVRLLAFEAGWWRVERADQPGGSTWSVYQILLEPDPVPGLAARLDRERRKACP